MRRQLNLRLKFRVGGDMKLIAKPSEILYSLKSQFKNLGRGVIYS